MKKFILLTVVAIFTITTGYAQALWTKTTESRLAAFEKTDRASVPKEFELYSLNYAAMKTLLQTAPSREDLSEEGIIVAFPNASGKLQDYRIYESSVMEAELAARNPNIRSYVGKGIDDPTAAINISTTIFGLHAMTLSANGTFYIDTYTKDLQNYIVYNKKSLTSNRGFSCSTETFDKGFTGMPSSTNTTMANDGKFRTYRLAMACTIEYAAYHVSQVPAGTPVGTEAEKKAAVLAAMNVTLTRINGIYERDLSLRMVLVSTNTNIIFITSDSFDNLDQSGNLINQSQSVITSTIGTANFDLGHTVSTGDGGVAALGGVCFSNAKAAAITGSPSPVGDPFDIDYVAHEMGHQFGAEHTFNSTAGGSCISQTRSPNFAVEPGSGSTIMAYAGICSQNVQQNSDDYFHTISISQIQANITAQSTCVAGANNFNTAPSSPALTPYTIPKGTPFSLTSSATDANGDAMTYTWEQIDANGSTALPSTTTTTGPSFRSFGPSTSPTRWFPSLATLVGPGSSTYEVVPNVARTMKFAFTVRDNRTPNGGQTTRRDVTITTNGTAGPFIVTSQNTAGIAWPQNQPQTVTWNVAGTTAAPVSTSFVDILLSTDGGLTYPTVLLANAPNNGSASVTAPNIQAADCRLMVKAVGNIYHAINTTSFSVGVTVENVCNTYTSNVVTPIPDGTAPNVGGAVAASVINVPATANISDINVSVNINHTWVQDLIGAVNHPDATQVFLFARPCGDNVVNMNATFSDGSPAITCGATMSGTFSPVAPLSALNDKPANGVYTLLLQDQYIGDPGSLMSWSVTICSQSITPLATESFGLQDFAIYPNPNKGNFNIGFTSATTNDIKVGVYDISGRMIFEKSFENTGTFAESLQLNNVQAGIYVVTVQDGNVKEVKKIVVE